MDKSTDISHVNSLTSVMRKVMCRSPTEHGPSNNNTYCKSSSSENVLKNEPLHTEKEDGSVGESKLHDNIDCENEVHSNLNNKVIANCSLPETDVATKCNAKILKTNTFTMSSGDTATTNSENAAETCKTHIDPLQNNLTSSITAALDAYHTLEQLITILDQKVNNTTPKENQFEKLQKFENEKMLLNKSPDTDVDVAQSIALLESVLESSDGESIKHELVKHQRQRSKSAVLATDDIMRSFSANNTSKRGNVNSHLEEQQLLRRQNTYSGTGCAKSKVSKWTKVKAAFKWERAHVPPAFNDTQRELGLQPLNYEIARYLRVPSVPCAGCVVASSADSILSSSSGGHLLSETAGSPVTISSASSIDENIDSSSRSATRRDSSKSDTRCDSLITDDGESVKTDFPKVETKTCRKMPFSASIKSLRKNNKIVSDFEVLPENVIADIQRKIQRKVKTPPSPLNLDLKQDFSDLDASSPTNLIHKSPRENTMSLWNHLRKINSPGNSSVPSSPSRHSDFFAEFESEEISSGGDFSEPVTPNHLNSYTTYEQRQEEIQRRYQALRLKLDKEFETKRCEWEKMKMNSNACRAITLINSPKSEERAPLPAFSAELLEESLTPDFKKKLRKWRVKKEISINGTGGFSDSGGTLSATQNPPQSPRKDPNMEAKVKIDWNLWKTGQIKLEGQGLSPLPEQKDLPEDFQKKLEQWQKIKRTGNRASTKRALKHSERGSIKKTSTDDENGSVASEKEKHIEKKSHERDKLEKFAKLRSIVADHPTKEIEVKTSAGVMKFEGISRKFTRKLYEWEKARGIGPESSTFALLHPGYCPIDVGQIPKELQYNDSAASQLSRSLSLNSITPNNVGQLAAISHQASSLSLNDVNDLKEMEGICNADATALDDDTEYKKFEEPEAVMVEVEDHIVETARPLITTNALLQQQIPIYRYEETTCNDFCNTRRVQSFESHTNLTPLLSALKRVEETCMQLKMYAQDICGNDEIRNCETIVSLIRGIYPYYTENLMRCDVMNAILDVQSELSRIVQLIEKSPLDEACCQEIMEERHCEYREEFKGLLESLQLLQQSIQAGIKRYPQEIVPDINITMDNEPTVPVETAPLNENIVHRSLEDDREQLSTPLEATDELNSASHAENEDTTNETNSATTYRNGNAGSSNGIGGAGLVKKKLRLRKMGSRQNSKTESSDSSDNETSHSIQETPRRWKRKNMRLKQRSFDEDYRRSEETTNNISSERDIVYGLKVKPGEPIAQYENIFDSQQLADSTNVAISPFENGYNFDMNRESSLGYNMNENIFVKTKRKVFTTIAHPTAIDGIAVIEVDIAETSEEEKKLENELKNDKQLQVSQEVKNITSDAELLNSIQNSTGCEHIKCKSISLFNIQISYNEDDRRCQSYESINNIGLRQTKATHAPLANDSFRIRTSRQYNASNKSLLKTKNVLPSPTDNQKPSKEHRFKKNPDKSASIAASRKVENKVSKLNVATFAQALHASMHQIVHTPLTERAQRLQKAKEDFLLQGASSNMFQNNTQSCNPTPNAVILNSENLQKYCVPLNEAATSNNELPKTSKTLNNANALTTTVAQSDCTDQENDSAYETLPSYSIVSRSAKMSSKLGFASLASKLRRVKLKDKKQKSTSTHMSPRQTLFNDILAMPQHIFHTTSATSAKATSTLLKSQSSPQTAESEDSATCYAATTRKNKDSLSKSHSEQYVKHRNQHFH